VSKYSRLSESDVERIINLIIAFDTSEKKFTWTNLLTLIESEGIQTTKQSLSKNLKVKAAYDSKKRHKVQVNKPIDVSRKQLSDRIKRLEAENQRLKDLNERLMERQTLIDLHLMLHGQQHILLELEDLLAPVNRDTDE